MSELFPKGVAEPLRSPSKVGAPVLQSTLWAHPPAEQTPGDGAIMTMDCPVDSTEVISNPLVPSHRGRALQGGARSSGQGCVGGSPAWELRSSKEGEDAGVEVIWIRTNWLLNRSFYSSMEKALLVKHMWCTKASTWIHWVLIGSQVGEEMGVRN